MNDWQAPEHAKALEAHLGWWASIWRAQAARGDAVTWAEPEFGPEPYVQTLPYTKQPVADIWQLNSRMGALLRARFEREGHAMSGTTGGGGDGGGSGRGPAPSPSGALCAPPPAPSRAASSS